MNQLCCVVFACVNCLTGLREKTAQSRTYAFVACGACDALTIALFGGLMICHLSQSFQLLAIVAASGRLGISCFGVVTYLMNGERLRSLFCHQPLALATHHKVAAFADPSRLLRIRNHWGRGY
jgi:hypothetical protein